MENNLLHLDEIREKIDALDLQIQHLINERARYALEVAKLKQQNQKNPTYYRPEREAQILRKIIKRNQGPLSSKLMAKIFLQIMAECRNLQRPTQIAIAAPYKSDSSKAAQQHFSLSIKIDTVQSIRKVFQQVQNKKVDYGIVPIENHKTGALLETLNQFLEFPLKICGEIITTPWRFLIIGNESASPSGDDKTSLVAFIANKPGSLAHILQPFASHHIDVSFIEYFPYQGNPNNYVFFLDLAGHRHDEKIKKALHALSQQSLSYVELGSYPKAVL